MSHTSPRQDLDGFILVGHITNQNTIFKAQTAEVTGHVLPGLKANFLFKNSLRKVLVSNKMLKIMSYFSVFFSF